MQISGVGTALVAGGSICGLFVAAALLRRGWTVRVVERGAVELAGRGAGIVTHDPLLDAFRAVGASTKDLGVWVQDRVAIDCAGDEVARVNYPQIVTSWDRIHQLLRALMPPGTYTLGRSLVAFESGETHVKAVFDDGSVEEADVLIGADGFRSAVRSQLYPKTAPAYSGYVVWRTIADEAQLPSKIRSGLFSEFGFFAPSGTQVVGYPIAGEGNDLRPGHRRYNFVWYCPVPVAELRNMLTDAEGNCYSASIPPPLVRDAVLARMYTDADRHLPPPFQEILHNAERPFFTPIYDHCSPTFATGRVALAGDAACVARPHVGMGVTKAAQDALALARCISEAPVRDGLANYSAERVPAAQRAYEQARQLGAYMLADDFPADQSGRNNPNILTILQDTAIPVL